MENFDFMYYLENVRAGRVGGEHRWIGSNFNQVLYYTYYFQVLLYT